MNLYKKETAEELSILEIASEMGHSIQVLPEGIAPAQDGAEIPSLEEIEAYRQTAWSAVQARRYKAKRSEEYPFIREQLDNLWHDIENGTLDKTGKFYTSISAVKSKHPKS